MDPGLSRHLLCLPFLDRDHGPLIGAFFLIILTLLTEWLTHSPTMQAAKLASARAQLLESSRRNAEALVAMSMVRNVIGRWSAVNAEYLASNRRASDVAGGLGAISKVLRLMLQSAVLGVGAYLVIYQEASAGIIIAGSILSARALAPVDIAIAHWRGWLSARQSWDRLRRSVGLSNGALLHRAALSSSSRWQRSRRTFAGRPLVACPPR